MHSLLHLFISEVDICKAEPGICGVGRICLDWAPPADPNTVSSPAATCSACSPGYVNSPLFTFSLEQYEFTRQVNVGIRGGLMGLARLG